MDNRTYIALLLIVLMTMGYMTLRARQQQDIPEPGAVESVNKDRDENGDDDSIIPPPADIPEERSRQDRPIDPIDAPELPPDPDDIADRRTDDVDPETSDIEVSAPPATEKGELIRSLPPSDRYELVFDTAGACLVSARMLNFRAGPEDESPLTVLESYETRDQRWASLLMREARPNGLPLDTAVYEVVANEDDHIIFQREFGNGLVVTRRYDFPAEKHHINMSVSMKNASNRPISHQYDVTAAGRIMPEYYQQHYMSALIAARSRNKINVGSKKFGDMEDGDIVQENSSAMPILWAGSANRYFSALLVPHPMPGNEYPLHIRSVRFALLEDIEREIRRDGSVSGTLDNAVASMTSREFEIEPGEEITHSYMFFIGPKDFKLFQEHEEYAIFEPLIDYGFFHFISAGVLWLMDVFYGIIPNYGVAIIMLTFLMRIVLHYFTRKSHMSMHRMQQIQPEMKKIQEKYKHDKQRAQRETMALFKKHGVNPMGGCMPLLLQLPIFFGLLGALRNSVQLRDAPFMLWITDLSRPDTLAHIGNISINVLPVLMAASMFFQQQLMPKSPDPQARAQQKMMQFLPLVFGFMLYNMASGLTLYWFTSTSLGIIEQKLIRRHMAKIKQEEAEGKVEPARKPAKAKR